MRRVAVAIFASTFSCTCVYGQAAGPYTPDQAISVLYEELRDLLGFNRADASKNLWLSLSMVGSLVDKDDKYQVNDLANFCPTTDPVVLTYGRLRKLDRIYDKINKSLTGPLRPPTNEEKKATAIIQNPDGNPSDKWTQYDQAQTKFDAAFSKFLVATDPTARASALIEVNKARQNWQLFGHRDEIDGAMAILDAAETRFSAPMIRKRTVVLQHYLDNGLGPSDAPGAALSPASQFSPTVDKWDDGAGWVGVKYSNVQTSSQFNSSTSSSRGFGGLNLGFVTIAGAGGGGSGTTSKVTKVYNFNYQFEIKRVTIRRPWFFPEVFWDAAAWTWIKKDNTPAYPHVAVPITETGKPVQSTVATYDNTDIGCAMVPTELIIARNRSVTATMDATDYKEVVNSGSSGVGGGLFGIIGGGGQRTWSNTTITNNGNTVTFKLDAPGIGVIGLISETIPKLPDPNLADKWPTDAWIPQ
jgi:hypothetical protein